MAVYGNVNVKYAPCKSVAQLHSAADYILGKKKEQLSSSVIKTKSELSRQSRSYIMLLAAIGITLQTVSL